MSCSINLAIFFILTLMPVTAENCCIFMPNQKKLFLILHFVGISCNITLHYKYNIRFIFNSLLLVIIVSMTHAWKMDIILIRLENISATLSKERNYSFLYISNEMHLYTVYLSPENCSTCFGWYLHPSSGKHITIYSIWYLLTVRDKNKLPVICI